MTPHKNPRKATEARPTKEKVEVQGGNKAKKRKKEAAELEANGVGSPAKAAATAAECRFPMSRVRRLVRSEDPGTRTTPESIFLINKASEMFVEKFAEDAYQNSVRERKKSVSYKHLSSTVCNKKRYEFLSDFVPEKVRAEDALKAWTLTDS